MYITNNDFDCICKALQLLPHGKEFESLPQDKQDIIVSSDSIMIELVRKKKKDNKRISEYIARKREHNKNYAR